MASFLREVICLWLAGIPQGLWLFASLKTLYESRGDLHVRNP